MRSKSVENFFQRSYSDARLPSDITDDAPPLSPPLLVGSPMPSDSLKPPLSPSQLLQQKTLPLQTHCFLDHVFRRPTSCQLCKHVIMAAPSTPENTKTEADDVIKNSRDWEVMTDIQSSFIIPEKNSIPGICEGFLMKKRKYPLQGWHKRYFVLEKGILKYSKSQQDVMRGKHHGALDVSLAVMSVNKKSRRIDLDTGDSLFHLKAKSQDIFYIWMTKLTAHRVYKKNEALSLHQDVLQALSTGTGRTLRIEILGENRSCKKEFNQSLRLSATNHTLASAATAIVPALGEPRSIPDYVYSQLSTPHCSSPEGKKLQQNIYVVSQRVHTTLNSIHEVLALERERLAQAWTGPDLRQSTSDQLASLCSTLSESRLTKVHSLSLSSESSEESFCTVRQDQSSEARSRLSVAESMAEYFDANEHIVSESLSENETSDESGLSDITTSNSEPEEGHAEVRLNYRTSVSTAPTLPSSVPEETGRRSALPARCADNSHIGILSILYNNIGKDLSRVSMPAALNEPLNFLQRVSEELEYSELLDIANRTDNPYDRMVSHHPPVSACHAESENFTFWQENKNEVQGVVLDQVGNVVHRFGGSWHEGIFCDTLPNPQCLWKPNPQPEDYFEYYGFSRYARELNELTPELRDVLPSTDTRFRPDQRLLEEGKVVEADKRKDEVEEKQRERRKELAKRGEEHIPRFFRKSVDDAGREIWLCNGLYWKIRKNPGLTHTDNLELW
ncbi:Oxysterol-binding protein-related protein 3 [Bagarius yarrelli]|uniref:Oxysterol-binding protein-related protein 3 n=1 Tax=Bagarius yarrelli TaxID=175774 RepID=A0A556VAQ4_BAGYA|nr:Oxysterol-binding protein-related protein 3 [Bagarius yarrelli]